LLELHQQDENNRHAYLFLWCGQCFSNWHHSPNQFVDPITELSFNSTEQYFMWAKATFFGDKEIADLVVKELDQRKIKELGRKIKNYNNDAWECVRFGFMVYANYLKYSQNASMGNELLSTQGKILVEASPYDTIWGVGLGENDPHILSEENWKGRNLLGKALMKVRTMLE
jgi:ribA/ribD-fused uncharacterized protein